MNGTPKDEPEPEDLSDECMNEWNELGDKIRKALSDDGWEEIASPREGYYLKRFNVPGGWLYRVIEDYRTVAMTFVPDPAGAISGIQPRLATRQPPSRAAWRRAKLQSCHPGPNSQE
jgi:hypothetical protein